MARERVRRICRTEDVGLTRSALRWAEQCYLYTFSVLLKHHNADRVAQHPSVRRI